MSTRRVSVCGASLVCRVESTRWPVWAALIAISAVSRSRTSPTITMSGSWRRKARKADAKVRPTFLLAFTWLTPGRLISAGSSAVEMLRSSRLRMFRPVYRETVLPLPVGRVTRIMPGRLYAEHGLRGIQNTQHDLLAVQRRAAADAKVDRPRLRQAHLDASILWYPPFGDVKTRHDFQPCRDLAGELHRRLRDLFQYAVHAQAHAKHFLIRFEVHIRGAATDRIQQYLVDEAHDRRIFDIVARDFATEFVVAATDLERLEIH